MNRYLILALVLFLTSCTICEDKDCFIKNAYDCGTVSYEAQEEYGIVQYEASGCVFTKTVVSLNEGEEEQIKNLVEGKSLSCPYTGALNTRWMYSLYADFEECDGELKEILEQLIVAA